MVYSLCSFCGKFHLNPFSEQCCHLLIAHGSVYLKVTLWVECGCIQQVLILTIFLHEYIFSLGSLISNATFCFLIILFNTKLLHFNHNPSAFYKIFPSKATLPLGSGDLCQRKKKLLMLVQFLQRLKKNVISIP